MGIAKAAHFVQKALRLFRTHTLKNLFSIRSGYATGTMPCACLHLVAVKFLSVATSKISTQQKH